MANKPISGLPVGGALTDANLLAAVQAGVTNKVTAAQLYDYIFSKAWGPAAGGGDKIVKRDSFGVIAGNGFVSADDGFGGGGYFVAAHNITANGVFIGNSAGTNVFAGTLRTSSVSNVEMGSGNVTLFGASGQVAWPAAPNPFVLTSDADGLQVTKGLAVLGHFKYGTYTAAANVSNGFMTIYDSAGTAYKLLVSTFP